MATLTDTRQTQVPDFTLPDSTGRLFHLYGHLPAGGTVVVFYRGHWCPYCRRYLAKLQSRWQQFTTRGAQLVAISPEPPGTSAALVRQLDLLFPLLSDVDGDVAARFGTRNGLAIARSLIPHPAVFIIDNTGTVRFRSIDRNYKKRTTMRTILAQLDDLAAG